MHWFRKHLVSTTVAAVALVAAVAWVAFGWFGVHTLFIDQMVDDELPVFAAVAPDAVSPAAPADPSTPPPTATPSTVDDAPETTEPETEPVEPEATEPETTEPETTEPVEPEIAVEAAGSFTSLGRYTTVGTASVLGDGSGQRFLRFEDFETSNGPDLRVYLVNSSAPGVSDHVDLGELRGNIGNQNYEIPLGVDLAVYDTVMIWCERFSSGFGEATLQLAA